MGCENHPSCRDGEKGCKHKTCVQERKGNKKRKRESLHTRMAAGVKAGPALLLNARAIGEHKLISGTQNNARKPTIHANLLDSAYKKRQGLFDQLQTIKTRGASDPAR